MTLSAAEQITERVLAYGRLVAAGDLEGVADLFVHGAVSGDAQPERAVGRDAVLALYESTLAQDGSTRRMRMTMSALDLAIDEDAGTATCLARFEVRPPEESGSDVVLFVGRYADRFARIDGRWEFTHRHVHLDETNEEAVRAEGVNLGR